LNTGTPSTRVPAFPGVTPATTLVPYSFMARVCWVPWCPVMPWTITRVFLSSIIDILKRLR
jgi:hypothetical protein